MEVTWALVTSISPVEVRFPGDTADTPIGKKLSGVTLATNDIVALAKTGTYDGWVILGKVIDT